MITDKYDNILFDLDGTLWDASVPLIKTWRKNITTYFPGEYVPDIACHSGALGMDRTQLISYYSKYYGDRTTEIIDKCLSLEVEGVKEAGGAVLFDGLEETLRKLSGSMKLFIVSNCQEGYIENFLDYSKTEKYFTSYICAGLTGNGKGKNALTLMERFGLSRCLFIGDTRGDEEAAREAGIDFAYAAYGFGSALQPDYVINSIKELVV